MPWLPDDLITPVVVELPTGHHLRPIRASDVALDYPAVMSSRQRLWSQYGAAWQWPSADMTFEADRIDLARHERDMASRSSYNYAVFDADETELLGCVYLDPPDDESPPGTDVVSSWWVVDQEAGGLLEQSLTAFVPRWLAETWGFRAICVFPCPADDATNPQEGA
jgi:hypothetical protein